MNKEITDTPERIALFDAAGERAGTLYRFDDGSENFEPALRVRRDVKDRLFKFIFGNPEHKEWALNLFNAIEHTEYSDPDDLEIRTLENAVYMNMKNDVSVLVGSWNLSFWEHQSTINPNIPLRLISYYASVMQGYISTREHLLYERKPYIIPNPKFYVFYNGKEEAEEISEMKLSDLYYNKEEEPMLDLKVIQFNLRYHEKWKDSCTQLYEYQWFVSIVRRYTKEMEISEAVDLALRDMPKEFTIRSFLRAHKSEVKAMSIFEYDEEKHMAYIEARSKAEGKAEERIHGILNAYQMAKNFGADDHIAIEKTAEMYQCSADQVKEIILNATLKEIQ